mgnify:CR=1 FL=1
MIMSLDLPSGYITRLTKSDLYYIPEDVGSFSKAIELITAVWKSKVVFILVCLSYMLTELILLQMQVIRTMEILQRTEKDTTNHLKNILSRKKSNRQTKIIKVLPDSEQTPTKR